MNNERIAVLLASGLKAAQVSTIVGVSPSRISQLMADEDFQNLLKLKEVDNNKKDVEETAITAKYHAAEHLLLDQITALAPISELRDVVGALKVVADRQDKAKQRINPNPVGGTVIHQNIVNLQLPSQALPPRTIHISGSREVVGIGETELAPMSSTAVTDLFKSMNKAKLEEGAERRGYDTMNPLLNDKDTVNVNSIESSISGVEDNGTTRALPNTSTEGAAQRTGEYNDY